MLWGRKESLRPQKSSISGPVRPDRAAIVVTHDDRIYHFADRIAHLDDGQVTYISTPAEALAESAQRAGDAARRH